MTDAVFGTALLGRLARDGASTALRVGPAGVPSADRALELLRAASARDDEDPTDCDRAIRDWDEAGTLYDPEALDRILTEIGGGRLLGGFRNRKLRRSARLALHSTERPETLCLAAAVLGTIGDRTDVPALAAVAQHPDLTLYGATALANVRHQDAYAALLRLLSLTEGEARILVIDRLLALTEHAVVRLALLRDALVGLPDELAREVATDVSDLCDASGIAADDRQDDALRAGARNVLRLAANADLAPDIPPDIPPDEARDQ